MNLNLIFSTNAAEQKYSAFTVKHKYVLFFCIVIAQLIFNCFKIDCNSLWYDECFSVYSGVKSISGIIAISKTDVNPPLYAIILHYWMLIFGNSEFSVRLLSAIAMALANGFLFLLCIKFFNWQTSIFSSLLFFVSYPLFYYAQEARTYALVGLVAVLAHYCYLTMVKSTIKNQQIKYIFFLAITYALLFYLHFLSCFLIIGHIIGFPLFLFKKNIETKKIEFNISLLVYYLTSGLFFVLMLLPFYNRFLGLVKEGGTKMWLQSPVFEDLKLTVYEFFNSKEVYEYVVYSVLISVILIIIFKKLRHTTSLPLMIFALISGPLVLYINYRVAALSPIFLLRYVLFTYIGFILVIAYVFSSINIKVSLKIVPFLVLIVYAFTKMTLPKEMKQDYKNAVSYLSSVKTSNTLITTDLADLYSYYYDKKIFSIENDTIKSTALFNKDVFCQFYDLTWPQRIDFRKYKYIYYTQSFAYLNDPNANVLMQLNEKFKFIKRINTYYGVHIVLYENLNYKPILVNF